MSESRNFILAIALSIGVLLLWQTFFANPKMEEERRAAEAAAQSTEAGQNVQAGSGSDIPVPAGNDAVPTPPAEAAPISGLAAPELPRSEALAKSQRIRIETPAVEGSIALTGARIDDLKLKRYHETVDDTSPIITLLSPKSAEGAYYAQFGWKVAQGVTTKLPGDNTVWTPVSSGPLTPDTPVQLYWDNGEGQRFTLKFAIDEDYLITVNQSVSNSAGTPVTVYPYGLMAMRGEPETTGYWILHEGFLGVFDEELEQITFSSADAEGFSQKTDGGWLGITSKYWMTAFVPDQTQPFTGYMKKRMEGGKPVFQAIYMEDGLAVQPGGNVQTRSLLFAGAKKNSIISSYEDAHNIPRFNRAIDWGWFFFLTIPFFMGLEFFFQLTGNFGVAILLLTVCIKLVFFPLANKSYEAMTKMKKVQPEMTKLRERFKEDKMRQQQELMALYKREKINPMAGCLPIIIQIPVFFSLYKVLFVTIEMRHAPFFGWIQDLSAPDPTSIFNLFGLIPWDPSAVPMIGIVLAVGVWPLVMGITMYLQMQMNPKPQDEVQQMVFAWMPVVFTIMLASFSAGLVIYWAWNNFLSIVQQYVIMRRMGVEPEWKNNIKIPDFLKSALGGKSDEAEPDPSSLKAQGALSKDAPATDEKAK